MLDKSREERERSEKSRLERKRLDKSREDRKRLENCMERVGEVRKFHGKSGRG